MMCKDLEVLRKSRYLRTKKRLLQELGIIVSDEIFNHICDLYPNDIAIENYIRSLILRSYSEN